MANDIAYSIVFISIRLDHYYSILWGVSTHNISHLQHDQNSLARSVCGASCKSLTRQRHRKCMPHNDRKPLADHLQKRKVKGVITHKGFDSLVASARLHNDRKLLARACKRKRKRNSMAWLQTWLDSLVANALAQWQKAASTRFQK